MNDEYEHIPLIAAIIIGIIGVLILAFALWIVYMLFTVVWAYNPWLDILLIIGVIAGIVLWYVDKNNGIAW